MNLKRGDVVRVNLDPVVGHEIGKTRPALIIQNDIGNRYSPTIIVGPALGHLHAETMMHVDNAILVSLGLD